MGEEFNELKQVEMSIKSAQHMVGQATRGMDEEQLKAATDALNQAQEQYKKAAAFQTGVDEQFLEFSEELLSRADEQLKEAKKTDS